MSEKKLSEAEVKSVIALFSNGEYQQAIDEIAILSKNFPKSHMLHNIKGACYAGLGQLDSAVKSYEKAIIIKPDYAKAHFNLGGALHELNDYEQSLKSYRKTIEIDPDYAEAHNNLGNLLREFGQLDEAINSYKNALNTKPDYLEVLYSLGLTFEELGSLDEMIEYLQLAAELEPNLVEAHNKIGQGLEKLDRFDEAIFSYQRAIEINPNFSEAYNNLGNILKECNRYDEAIIYYLKALKITPDYPALHNNLGNAYRENGKPYEAIRSYENALASNPDLPESHNNLGLVFFELGQLDNALKSFKLAIKNRPSYDEAHNNLGSVFVTLNLLDEALKSFSMAIKISPDFDDAYNNIGNIFLALNQTEDAIKSYKKTIALNPDFAAPHNNLGNAFKAIGKLDEAVLSYKKAIELSPAFAEAFNNLGSLLSKEMNELDKGVIYFKKAIQINPDFEVAHNNLGNALFKLNHFEDALTSYSNALNLDCDSNYIYGNILNTKMSYCNWNDFHNQIKELNLRINNKEKTIEPFVLMGLIDKPDLQRQVTEIRINNEHPRRYLLPDINPYPKHPKIRIGYFSADFREHPVGYLTAGLYELHDRDHFEIHAFSFTKDTKDELNLRIKAGVDHFHDVDLMSHKEVALLARSLEIDIAVDLGGFTENARTNIFALTAAPIQLSYIGYLGTMGADYYDYLIADPIMIPQENQKHYVEKIVYLPSFQVNDSKDLPPDTILSRKDVGLPEKGFVFCCFNNTYKFTPTIFDSWARILKAVKDSVLLIYVDNSSAEANLSQEIIKRGIKPNRLIFGERLKRKEYLARYRVADLFLDTHPYNAGTTASDALKMGLPMLTYLGRSYQARMGASIVNALNLPEMVTNSLEEYESLAIELATNPDKLKKIKEKLQSNLTTAPLFDTPLFTKNIESAYTQMYERHHAGLKPDHIYVEK